MASALFAVLDPVAGRYVSKALPAVPCPGVGGQPCAGPRCLVCPGHGFIPAAPPAPIVRLDGSDLLPVVKTADGLVLRCRLDGDAVCMSGGRRGDHRIWSSVSSDERIRAHWEGYVWNNGGEVGHGS